MLSFEAVDSYQNYRSEVQVFTVKIKMILSVLLSAAVAAAVPFDLRQ
jgi:hypothetical protein